MTRGEHPDAGMLAVARVRGVREQDSRLGLRQAAADEREAWRRVSALEEQLAQARPVDGDLASFLAVRTAGQALAHEVGQARQAATAARTVVVAAREHWQRDKTRLSAVELLLERRAEARRAERARREAAELDDIVSARWQHSRHARTGGAHA